MSRLGGDVLGKGPAGNRLELGHGEVMDDRTRFGRRFEPDVNVGRPTVRGRRLLNGINLLSHQNGRAALTECQHHLARERAQAAEVADDHPKVFEVAVTA